MHVQLRKGVLEKWGGEERHFSTHLVLSHNTAMSSNQKALLRAHPVLSHRNYRDTLQRWQGSSDFQGFTLTNEVVPPALQENQARCPLLRLGFGMHDSFILFSKASCPVGHLHPHAIKQVPSSITRWERAEGFLRQPWTTGDSLGIFTGETTVTSSASLQSPAPFPNAPLSPFWSVPTLAWPPTHLGGSRPGMRHPKDLNIETIPWGESLTHCWGVIRKTSKCWHQWLHEYQVLWPDRKTTLKIWSAQHPPGPSMPKRTSLIR